MSSSFLQKLQVKSENGGTVAMAKIPEVKQEVKVEERPVETTPLPQVSDVRVKTEFNHSSDKAAVSLMVGFS